MVGDAQMVRERPIGVFDSGVGGVSVLRELTKVLPCERFIFYGDNLNAPYGVRDEEDICRLTLEAADLLLRQNIKALVIACNTATSAAAETLRARLDIPVVGMEPALKPAALRHENGLILVLATPATLKQRKFNHLMELYGQNAAMVPCAGLMEFVERGDMASEDLHEYLRERFLPYAGQRIDAVVLGCTHYVFLREAIARTLPGVPQYDGNIGTARRLETLLLEKGIAREAGEGGVIFMTSADEKIFLPLMERLYMYKRGDGESGDE